MTLLTIISPWLFEIGDGQIFLIKAALCVAAAFLGRWVVGLFD